MIKPQFSENPLQIKLSFYKLIEGLENTAATDTGHRGMRAKELLAEVAPYPELREGITDAAQIDNNPTVIRHLLEDIFPPALTNNEIKAISIPFIGIVFNNTKRFQKILDDAGSVFEFNIRDFDKHQFYVMTCCLILNEHYGTSLNFNKPLFYDIPNSEGVLKHYRILYNADFMEIVPTEKSVQLTQDDIDLLVDNYDNLDLWKEKFPVDSWILKGFGVMTLVDVTIENALSILKGTLLGSSDEPDLHHDLESIFRSIFGIPDIHIGFTHFEQEEGKFSSTAFGNKFQSYILPGQFEEDCKTILRSESYNMLINEHQYFTVSDVSEFSLKHPESKLSKHLLSQKIESFILAPVVKNGHLLGILEMVSSRTKDFNSVNANKMEIVMPFIVDTIDRKITELQTQIQAVIQNNYTTLHPSVNWKFKREAQNYIMGMKAGVDYPIKEITFKEVYPLYGQIDIKDSSITRNASVKNDLSTQLIDLISLLELLHANNYVTVEEQQIEDLKGFVADLSASIRADTEQHIQGYLRANIYPLLNQANGFDADITVNIDNYFKETDPLAGKFNNYRRSYEQTLLLVNTKLTNIIDKRQIEIQQYFPHYYERFKTDGVEHNLYIGNSITPNKGFAITHLQHLRLWQLQVLCEMAIEQHYLKPSLPYQLGVTGLLLVFSSPLAIRFRMDEKHFDVDGAYNIRYEVIKKRIDKAFVKNSTERITQLGKIVIVYTKNEEEAEYRKYISLLQDKRILAGQVEQFDIEDLQGVSGLRALRVAVLYEHAPTSGHAYCYDDLYHQLNEIQL